MVDASGKVGERFWEKRFLRNEAFRHFIFETAQCARWPWLTL